MNQPLTFTIWRDSVCAGDDGDAPHEKLLLLAADVSVGELIERCLAEGYLASIMGGQATWVLEARRPLAVFAQQWTAPRLLVPPETRLASVIDSRARPHLQWRYYCQAAPESVFERLVSEQPLPTGSGV